MDGMDCWGLFMEAQRRFGRTVPDYKVSCFDTPGIADAAAAEIAGRWERIEDPEPGCAVAMALDPHMPDCCQHFGIYVGGGRFLHTIKKAGSSTASVHDPFWSRKVRGYYRWVK